MIWYNLKTIYRKGLKNKCTGLFNILGLSIGFACTLILLSWVTHEFSYDSFFKNKENIYRLSFSGKNNKEDIKICSSPQGIGPEALAIFPEVQNFTRIRTQVKTPFKVGENRFFVDKGLIADSTFFSVFSYESLVGNLSNVLNKKNLIVIDEYLAKKYFGTEIPLGKYIEVNNQMFTVSAVIKNVPENSHLRFHYVIPVMNQPEKWHHNKWGSDNCTQYLVMNHNIDKLAVEDKLTQMLLNKNQFWQEFNPKLSLQPLEEIHFSSGYMFDNAQKGNRQNVYFLVSVAFLILLIACVNFTNMFISITLKRTCSTGMKIASGASKQTIVKEISIEVLLYILISFIFSVVLAKLALPIFNHLIDTRLDIQIFSLNFLFVSTSQILLILLFASFFPGFYITSFNPTTLLKGSFTGKKNNLQNGLVTLQFVIAIVLIISVVVIQKQVDFFKTKQLGFNKNNIVYIHTLGEFNNTQNIKRFKDELIKNPNIEGITALSCLPTLLDNGGSLNPKNNPNHKVHVEKVSISESYFDVMQIEFLEGTQQFNYSNPEIRSCVINEIAAKKLNLTPPYTGQFIFDSNENSYVKICGVIKDVYTKSLNHDVKACMYTKSNSYYNNGVILLKLTGNITDAINSIKSYCIVNNGTIPFECNFLDQTYDDLYKSEIRMRKILSWFSFLSVILTSMGLLAMAYYIIENKTKEIGIRKVNGAKAHEIIIMLNKGFLKWVAIAFVIACPIAYYAMSKWLANFAYKTELSWWIFALAGSIAMGIALLTVTLQSWRAATRNPVESLRYE